MKLEKFVRLFLDEKDIYKMYIDLLKNKYGIDVNEPGIKVEVKNTVTDDFYKNIKSVVITVSTVVDSK